MRTTILSGLLATALLTAMLGCGTQNVGIPASPGRDTAAFKLKVLDDSFVGGASASDISLKVEEFGQDVMVSITATKAVDLKALYVGIDYNPEAYRPLTAAPAMSLPGKADYISMSYLKDRGTMWYGQVLTNYEWRPGVSGDAVLATAVFRKGRMSDVRSISTPPIAPSEPTTAIWDGTDTLSWYFHHKGDYDQNSEVNIADLTPIGNNFGEASPGGFAEPLSESVVDGDDNGEINIADLTPIGQCFGRSAASWNVYSSDNSADYPAAGVLVGTAADRKHFSLQDATLPMSGFYWVRPSDGSTDGIPSNLVGTNPALLPEIILTNPPATGSGTNADPYILDPAVDYIFQLNDTPGGTDVTSDPLTDWTSWDATDESASGDNIYNILDSYPGPGNIGLFASYQSTNSGNQIFVNLATPPSGDLFILADPADTDWTGVTGAGTVADPYITADSGFNTDTLMVFDFIANTVADGSGTAIDVATLTWGANPPFIVDFLAGPGKIKTNGFTTGYVSATDGVPTESNQVYVENHLLP
jgi:hypothetical protein